MDAVTCRRDVSLDVYGSPCPDCGHTGLVHPGAHNPAVAACVLCQLAATLPPARCGCECSTGGWCGGCGHRGCGRR